MAKLSGFISKFAGAIGNVVFRRVNGQTIASEKPERKSVPSRSAAQMQVRMRNWANLVNLWSTFDSLLHPSFETRPKTSSDYNHWLALNHSNEGVYLTKSQAAQGGAVVDNYMVSEGSLPPIGIAAGTGNVPVTDIVLSPDFDIDGSTTLKDFSNEVIAQNARFRNGDKLTCFIAIQSLNSATNVPYVTIKAMQVQLDVEADTSVKVRSLVSADGFSAVDGCLGASSAPNGAIVWVHSRKSQGRTLVSTQRFEVSNSYLSQFKGAEAYAKAVASYGGEDPEKYLTPVAIRVAA